MFDVTNEIAELQADVRSLEHRSDLQSLMAKINPSTTAMRVLSPSGVRPLIELHSLSPDYQSTAKGLPYYFEPHEWKGTSLFAQLQLDVRTLKSDVVSFYFTQLRDLGKKGDASQLVVPAELELLQLMTGKVRPTKAEVLSVDAAYIAPKLRGQGYGLLMYLKAVDLAYKRGMWMTNDFVTSTSTKAAGLWKAIGKYTVESVDMPFRRNGLDATGKARTLYAAHQLNGAGKAIVSKVPVMHSLPVET